MPEQQAGGHLEFFSQRVFIKLLNNNKCNGRREVVDSLGPPSENGVQKLWETNRGGKLPAERRKLNACKKTPSQECLITINSSCC